MHFSCLKSYEGKNVLITGANGYLASSLVANLSKISCHITCVSRQQIHSINEPISAQISEVQGDLTDKAIWETILPNQDILFHFAAQTSLRFAESNPYEDFQANIIPLVHMIDVLIKRKQNLDVLFAGTVTQMGLSDQTFADETAQDTPITVYDFHKLEAERFLKFYSREGTIRAATLRLSNIYGPSLIPEKSDRGILNQMVLQASKQEDLAVFKPSHLIRDYLFIDDALNAFLTVGAMMEKCNGEHFIVASGVGHSLKQAFQKVSERAFLQTGVKVKVNEVDPTEKLNPIEMRSFIGNTRKLTSMTGWKATYSLEEGLDKTLSSLTGNKTVSQGAF